MTSSTVFSQELIDLVIDHLHDAPRTLSSCALVERSWTPATRYHLYSSINFHPGLLFYNSSKNVPRIERLLSLLNSPHSTIRAQDIREITLLFSSTDHEYFSYLVTQVMTRLPALQSLNFLPDITESSWTRRNTVVYYDLQALDEIEDFYEGFEESPLNWSDKTANFFTIVSSIPHLRRLKAVWAPSLPEAPILNTSKGFPPHLSHLVVRGMKTAMVQWWLAGNSQRPPVRSVELQSVYPNEMPLIGAFFEALGPSLVDLRVFFKGPRIETEDAFCKNVNLAHNTSLQTLEIGDVTLEPKRDPETPVYFEWLFRILTQIESKNMKHIKIWLHVGEATLDVFDWGKLDDILARPLFEHLEMLTFSTYILDRTCDFVYDVVQLLPNYQGWIHVERLESCEYRRLQM